MIKIHITNDRHIFITRGSRRLFIERNSLQRNTCAFQDLVNLGQISVDCVGGTVEFSETQRTRHAFIDLMINIQGLYAGDGVLDTVEHISISSLVRFISEGSVLA